MRIIQGCFAWLFLSATCVAAGFRQPDTPVTNCAASPAIHRAVEKALLSIGWISWEAPAFESLRCYAPASTSETIAVNRVRKDPVLHTVELTLGCIPKEACRPFLVSVPDDKRLHPMRGEDTVRQETRSSPYRTGVPKTLRQNRIQPAPLVVPGQVLTLVWEQATLHLTRKVICLDRGNVGEEVRTRPIGIGHVVRARVIDASSVKAIL